MRAFGPHRIRDPVHGFVHFSDQEKEIIDNPFFQRLRRIRQLSFCEYVYPGATHTRFEHSIGVMQLADRAFLVLEEKHLTELSRNFSQIGWDLNRAREVLRLAALLHDVGHLPFSHAGEIKDLKHESIGRKIMDQVLRSFVDGVYEAGTTDAVLSVLSDRPLTELRILHQLLKGQLDADRMDYLLRDSLHCGVYYGQFDWERLVESLALIKSPEGGLELAIEEGGVHSLEALLVARYFMYSQVYCHRTRRIYDIYLAKFLMEDQTKLGRNSLIEKWRSTPESLLSYDDHTMMDILRSRQGSEWAQRIVNRRHHTVFFQTSDTADQKERVYARRLFAAVSEQARGLVIIPDWAARGAIHTFMVRGRHEDMATESGEEKYGEEFYVVTREPRQLRPVADYSAIIAGMPPSFCVIRFYCEKTQKQVLRACVEELREQLQPRTL